MIRLKLETLRQLLVVFPETVQSEPVIWCGRLRATGPASGMMLQIKVARQQRNWCVVMEWVVLTRPIVFRAPAVILLI